VLPVEDDRVGANRQGLQGTHCGEPQRGRHPQVVDLFRGGVSQGERRDPLAEFFGEFGASSDRDELGVGEAFGGSAQSGDRRADGDGAGPRTAPHLVDAGNDLGSGRGAE
jgi:hypothetical protein